MNFSNFKNAVAKQFKLMQSAELYRTATDNDTIWKTYLESFPAGSNPIHKERTEHDCNCCKQFVRAVGNVVAIIDNQVVSIWDIDISDLEPEYQIVANAMSKYVKSKDIANQFLHFEKTAGTDKNYQNIVGEQVKTWDHFFVNIPAKYVVDNSLIPTKLGESRSLKDVFKRSLEEITPESINIVLELISANSIYKGEENKYVVSKFKLLKKAYDALSANGKKLFIWEQLAGLEVAVAKIKNTSIGTLLSDISEGVELDAAVRMFESKVAPQNYKRPTAVVTKGMIEKAKQKIEELGLTSALGRRYAQLSDITINNIIFANRNSTKVIAPDVFAQLTERVTAKTPKLDAIEEISIEKFISDVVPNIDSLEVLLENRLSGNLVSLVAPLDPTAGNLFKWNNNFSWSYNGEVTDSIKERVKAAGGQVTGDLCCRLAWDYTDDLDFVMHEPNGHKIYFGNRREKSVYGGMLDVDANGVDGIMAQPVENIFYKDKSTMREGNYTLSVNNYNRRSDGRGFEIEIEALGQTYNMSTDKILKSKDSMIVAVINYSKVNGFTVKGEMEMKSVSKQIWNIPTQVYHNVNLMMFSPNYWDEMTTGNKHYFFMLENCINPERTRGFYNEFLKSEFDPHRKVFEMVGASMKTEESTNQLSGVGFSSTQKSEVVVRVKGTFTRNLKIKF